MSEIWAGVIFLSNGKPGITSHFYSKELAIDAITKPYYNCECYVELSEREYNTEIYVDKVFAAEVYQINAEAA